MLEVAKRTTKPQERDADRFGAGTREVRRDRRHVRATCSPLCAETQGGRVGARAGGIGASLKIRGAPHPTKGGTMRSQCEKYERRGLWTAVATCAALSLSACSGDESAGTSHDAAASDSASGDSAILPDAFVVDDATPDAPNAFVANDATPDVADVFVPTEAPAVLSGISGVVQEGPFERGSSVTVQELDVTLKPTGLTFNITTRDDEGDFTLPSTVTSQYVEVIASGYYFDEIENQLSAAPLTLRALGDVSSNATVDVNLLTSMSEPLVFNAVAQGASFAQATAQAEATVLAALGLPSPLGSQFSSVPLTGTNAASAELLAASLIVEQYARGMGSSEQAQLAQVLGGVGAVPVDSGTGDATLNALNAALCRTIWSINVVSVRANLTNYYASLGASVTIPPFEQFLCGCGIMCGTTCVDELMDTNNCGACGTTCATGASCQSGSCGCPSGEAVCSGGCVNVQADSNNCGACGNQCTVTGQTCQSGRCACPNGPMDDLTENVCNGVCVDEQVDTNNCGVCGTACATGASCQSGTCTCPTGLGGNTETVCGGACVNEQTDTNNCGGCGNKCLTGEFCGEGACDCSGILCGGICCSGCSAVAKSDCCPNVSTGGCGCLQFGPLNYSYCE